MSVKELALLNRDVSRQLHARASKVIPGGVNSPVRAFKSVACDPPYINRGKGSHMWDVDGHEYIDYVGSWGPLILGHAFPDVVEAVEKANRDGASFGACTRLRQKSRKR
jgi:glutamate-1-semialdehyde 2,1-aminomutase